MHHSFRSTASAAMFASPDLADADRDRVLGLNALDLLGEAGA